jgi:hypothetical protein
MKVHQLTVRILDFEDLGAKGVVLELENARFANDCISPDVAKIETREIEWTDDHPLNKRETKDGEWARLFYDKDQYNGNWFDKHGGCKVCGGEIPHGHSDNCDVYKMECQVRELKEELIKTRPYADAYHRICHALKIEYNILGHIRNLQNELKEMKTREFFGMKDDPGDE